MKRRKRRRIVIGLTGSFGSGKTTVAGFFRSMGAQILDADKIAHAIIRPQAEAYKKIVKTFGKEIIKKDKSVDRDRLARIVFNNRVLLKKLNSIIHPRVIRIIKEKIEKASKRIIILDVPLLIETGLKRRVDKIIVVNIARDRQIERLRAKTGLSRQEILKRIKAQMPLNHKVRLADFVIDNSGTMKETRKQAIAIRRLLWKS